MSELKLILTTFSSDADATNAIRSLLEERLIACGTMIPGTRSFYHWKGGIEEATEVMVFLKTDRSNLCRCMEYLAESHSYEVPEIIVLNPEEVSAPYLAWVKGALRISDSTLD